MHIISFCIIVQSNNDVAFVVSAHIMLEFLVCKVVVSSVLIIIFNLLDFGEFSKVCLFISDKYVNP